MKLKSVLTIGAGAIAILAFLASNKDRFLKYFDLSEFDSPDITGSGHNMKESFLLMLDKARGYAGRSMTILSGWRSFLHNMAVGGVEDSTHTYGYGADILTLGEADSKVKAKALYKAGFRRFGIRANFSSIHVDNHPDRSTPALWGYDGKSAPYNPKNL